MARNSMFALEPGEIIRIWDFFVSGQGRVVETIWATVVKGPPLPGSSAQAEIEIFFGSEDTWEETCLDSGDRWERPSPSKIPNYASVALAKFKLTGERTAVRTTEFVGDDDD